MTSYRTFKYKGDCLGKRLQELMIGKGIEKIRDLAEAICDLNIISYTLKNANDQSFSEEEIRQKKINTIEKEYKRTSTHSHFMIYRVNTLLLTCNNLAVMLITCLVCKSVRQKLNRSFMI